MFFFFKSYQDIFFTASILISSKSQLYELNPEFNFKGISIPFTHKGQFSHEDSHSDSENLMYNVLGGTS